MEYDFSVRYKSLQTSKRLPKGSTVRQVLEAVRSPQFDFPEDLTKLATHIRNYTTGQGLNLDDTAPLDAVIEIS